MTLVCGSLLFFRIEQSAVQRSRLGAKHVADTNEQLRKANEALEAAKKNLEADEDECVSLGAMWRTLL